MPRILARAGILVALFTPTLALAAYNDVTLTTDVVLTVNGITLNVSGQSSTIESLVVDASTLTATILSGSDFQVSAPGFQKLSPDVTTGQTSKLCNSATSLLRYTPSSTVTVVITPSTSLCGASGGGGGGSSSSSSASPAPVETPAVTAPASTPAVVAPAEPAQAAPVVAAPTSASGLSASQIQSILDVLASFEADAATIALVKASLEGTAPAPMKSIAHVFSVDLSIGSTGSEAKALQEYLNAHGYTVAQSGPGSPGNETMMFGSATKAALIRFQKAKGITPAVGYFGPKTRATMNAGS